MNIASKFLNAAGLACVLVLQTVSAKETRWTGNAGTTDWATDGNWDNGAPTAEDTAKIIGSPNSVTVNIASPASVYILYLQGTVTLNGAELTITGKTATASGGGVKAWEQAGGGTYTYNCPLKFTNPLSGNVALSGTAYICGGIDYGNTFTAAGMGTTYIRNTPIRTNKFSPLNNKVYIEVPSNSLGGVTFGGPAAEIHVMVDDPWLDTGFDSLTITQGKLELHGHRCHVTNKLVMTSGALNTDEPATLAFSQRSGGVIQTNSSVEISGPLTLRMDSSSTKHFVLNRSISSSGSLIVEGGTFHFGPSAGWPYIASMTVNGGKVDIAENVNITVPALYLNGSQKSAAAGTYGSSESGADHTDDTLFAGKGMLTVAEQPAEPSEAVWQGGAEDNLVSTGDNWEDGLPDYTSGGLLATFATGGVRAETAGAAAFRGIVFDAPGPFALAANGAEGSVSIGGDGIVTAQAADDREYSIEAPVALTDAQIWNVASGTVFSVRGEISSGSDLYGVEKRGLGTLALCGTNTFNSTFVLTNGIVDVVSRSNALGRAYGDSAFVVKEGADTWLRFAAGGVTVNEKPLTYFGTGRSSYSTAVWTMREGSTNIFRGPIRVDGIVRGPWMETHSEIICEGGVTRAGTSGTPYWCCRCTQGDDPCVRIRNTPATLIIFELFNTRLSLETPGNTPSTITCYNNSRVETPVAGALNSTDVRMTLSNTSVFDLCGFDQTIGTLFTASTGYVTNSGAAATLSFCQNKKINAETLACTNSTMDFAGALSISKSGQYAFVWNRTASAVGGIEVLEGDLEFTAAAAWPNATSVKVGGTGRLLAGANGNFGRDAEFTISEGGVIHIPAGVKLRCSKLIIIDGENVSTTHVSGLWGATGSGAKNIDDTHFTGGGTLRVGAVGLGISLK